MSVPTDTVLIRLPADLVRHYGIDRLRVEAVETIGAAIFVAATLENGEAVTVHEEHRKALETAFLEARKQRRTEDETTAIRDADSRHAREHGRGVRHSRNTGGYRRVRRTWP